MIDYISVILLIAIEYYAIEKFYNRKINLAQIIENNYTCFNYKIKKTRLKNKFRNLCFKYFLIIMISQKYIQSFSIIYFIALYILLFSIFIFA